ncbi:hypothetical protein [Phaffia rhodozyma]|uniref:Uncharacterized protein n=1 Tax=Phaffia rhodozyma TaxID=264483 RepID=A0A0F7SGK2_PHARH|nr:hypothetical protein [Phaffia rhodozyma]
MEKQHLTNQPLRSSFSEGSSHRAPTSFNYPIKRTSSTPSAPLVVGSDVHTQPTVLHQATQGNLKSVQTTGSILTRFVSARTSSDGDDPQHQHHSQRMSFHIPSASILEAIPASRSGGTLGSVVSADERKLAKIHRFPMNADDETHNGAPLIDSLSPSRRRTLDDCLDLFSGRASKTILERSWTSDAIFEDPSIECHGYHEYSAHWSSVPESRIIRLWILPSRTPSELRWEQIQERHSRILKTEKIVHSIVVVELDGEDRIIKMQDLWDGKELSSGLRAIPRKVNAKITSEFSGKPSND